jgi:hypothetical protein
VSKLQLTQSEIEADIRGFKDRLFKAEARLLDIRTGAVLGLTRRQRNLECDRLRRDIVHIKQLISYANDALAELSA